MYTELMYGAVLQSYPKLNERYQRTEQPGSADICCCCYVERHSRLCNKSNLPFTKTGYLTITAGLLH